MDFNNGRIQAHVAPLTGQERRNFGKLFACQLHPTSFRHRGHSFQFALTRTSCKIHAVVDALGLPIKFILMGGQEADITQAIPLMEGVSAQACLVDQGYDSEAFLAWLHERHIQVVIPPTANRKEQRSCDWWRHKEHHVVECLLLIPATLESDSRRSWAPIPEQAGQSARSDAGCLVFTRMMSSWSSCRAWA